MTLSSIELRSFSEWRSRNGNVLEITEQTKYPLVPQRLPSLDRTGPLGKNVLYGFLEILDSSSRRPSVGLSSQ